jgi:hypothetical protein
MTGDPTRLTDKVGVISLDATEYEHSEYVTTVNTDELQRGLRLLDELGWDSVDIAVVPPRSDDANPLLGLQQPRESLMSGDQAAITIAPLTDKGRDLASGGDSE